MARRNNSAAATKRGRKAEVEVEAEAEAEDAASTSSSDAADDGVASDGESDESMSDGGSGSGSGSDDDGEERPDSQMEESDDGSDEESGDDDSDGDDDADDDDEQPRAGNGRGGGGGGGGPRPSANGDEQCTFDLSNLATFNTHQVDVARLRSTATSSSAEGGGVDPGWYAVTPTIAAAATTSSASSAMLPPVNESFLLSKAAEGATQLLAELWTLPTERTDAGPKARLPSGGGDTVRLPRALPPPPPKQKSKWEQFALQRGIAPKSKRSRKAFDEATGEWKHLTGSLQDKANAGPESWPIMEVKKNDDPMADPWEKIRDEKKTRVQKNTEARMRNAERAGTLDRGSANRLAKNAERLEKQRDVAREKERRRGLEAPAGVPLDVGKPDARRGKPSTQLALRATQVSTASLGRFDRQREGEPEKKKTLSRAIHGDGRKRKQDGGDDGGGTNKKFLQGEARKSSDILKRVMDGGSASKEKERDVRKGKYAKGETAYDNEFDDGLGAGSFRKKKGRAGMGKMKKMTKKRIK